MAVPIETGPMDLHGTMEDTSAPKIAVIIKKLGRRNINSAHNVLLRRSLVSVQCVRRKPCQEVVILNRFVHGVGRS